MLYYMQTIIILLFNKHHDIYRSHLAVRCKNVKYTIPIQCIYNSIKIAKLYQLITLRLINIDIINQKVSNIDK